MRSYQHGVSVPAAPQPPQHLQRATVKSRGILLSLSRAATTTAGGLSCSYHFLLSSFLPPWRQAGVRKQFSRRPYSCQPRDPRKEGVSHAKRCKLRDRNVTPPLASTTSPTNTLSVKGRNKLPSGKENLGLNTGPSIIQENA